jgi:CheY-like chemotaxis protein
VSQGEAAKGSSAPRKPTIVVVDASEATLAATTEILQRAGYRVISRDRPAGCVAMMLEEKPDLVLLDGCTPTVFGDTVVKLFSTASPNSGTIILFHSALDERLLESKVKSAGAHGYIRKTSDGAALLRGVRRWLRPSLIDVRAALPSEMNPLDRSRPAVTASSSTAAGSSTSVRAAHSLRASASSVNPAARSMPAASAASAQGAAARRRAENPEANRLRELDLQSRASGERRRTSGAFPLEAPRVLFVDDDMLVLSGYRRQLDGQPFEFEFALSGSQALRHLTSATPPSVIVSDLLMPEPNGREVLRRALDRDPSWSRRFIIVTAQSLQQARSELDPRFYGTLLRKPVETHALSSAIRGSLAAMGLRLSVEGTR